VRFRAPPWRAADKENEAMDPVIVAKMYCSETTRQHSQGGATEQERVKLSAVYGEKGTANATWSRYTPSGSVDLTISNPDAIGLMKPGYYKVLLVPCGVDD
jgi:hypothetical protein